MIKSPIGSHVVLFSFPQVVVLAGSAQVPLSGPMLFGRSTQAGLMLVTVSAEAFINGKLSRSAPVPIFSNALIAIVLGLLEAMEWYPLYRSL
jgi:hypothetical protein